MILEKSKSGGKKLKKISKILPKTKSRGKKQTYFTKITGNWL